ncbi:MAG: hypothetical protein JSR91_02695 [Proteobacteria bacterium]|nr:hypothetical protein [Pseudomonadota bacterium]
MTNAALVTDAAAYPAASNENFGYSSRPSLLFFSRSLALAAGRADGFGRSDMKRVEAVWELSDDGDWTSCGYVVALRDGRRIYMQYHFGERLREDDDGADLIERVELMPLEDDGYPQLPGIGIEWDDDLDHINEHLAA